jgi:hypothetical protein
VDWLDRRLGRRIGAIVAATGLVGAVPPRDAGHSEHKFVRLMGRPYTVSDYNGVVEAFLGPDTGQLPVTWPAGPCFEESVMIEITSVNLTGGEDHEHIANVRRLTPETGNTGASSREAVVEWLRKPGARAVVRDGSTEVEVRMVDAATPYLRTFADGIPTDNLLALPRYSA